MKLLFGKFLAVAALASVIPLVRATAGVSPEGSPSDVVERLQSVLVQAHGPEAPEYPARKELLADTVRSTHDFTGLARSIAGEVELSLEEVEGLAATLADYFIASYAALYETEEDPSFVILLEEVEASTARVEAGFSVSDEDPIPVRYELASTAEGWRILGTSSEGLEGLELSTTALSTAFAEHGLEKLTQLLERSAARYAEEPVAVIARLQSELLGVMKEAEALGYGGRYERLAPVIADTHNLQSIGRLAIKSSWDELSDDQRALFETTFRRLSIATYASRFDGFSGESFGEYEAEELRRGGVMVKSVLKKSAGGEVSLDYLLYRRSGRWSIINVIADGVSDLATKRAEYKSVLKADGFEGLIGKLEDQTRRYAEGAD